MATDIPADIFSYSIQSQINTTRFSNKMVQDIISLLNDADAELLAKLEKWGDSGRFTPTRLKALLAELRKINAETYAQAHNEMKSGLIPFAEHVAVDTAAVLATQLPVDFSLIGVTTDQLKSIISETPIVWGENKAKLLEETFAELSAGKEASIRGAIRLGQIEGDGVSEIVRRLKGSKAAQYKDGILEASRRDCATIVRTVCNFTSNQAQAATLAANAKVLNGWRYISTLDGRTSLTCRALSNTVWPIGEGPIPPRHPNCRSFQLPEIKTFKEMGLDLPEFEPSVRASKNGPVRSDITMDEFMRSQPKKDVVEMLGPSRAKLFLDGKLDIQKFASNKGIVYTLDELKSKNAAVFAKVFSK